MYLLFFVFLFVIYIVYYILQGYFIKRKNEGFVILNDKRATYSFDKTLLSSNHLCPL